MVKIRQSLEKINLEGYLAFDEPFSKHCTFEVGGPVSIWYRPKDEVNLLRARSWAVENSLTWMVVGGGANIVPSDKGFAGLVIDTSALCSLELKGNIIRAGAGISATNASAFAADNSLAGLDFIYAMPGSLGGALYMNARCYDGEMSTIAKTVRYLDEAGSIQDLDLDPKMFDYKLSPFTQKPYIILSMELELTLGNSQALWERMKSLEADRRAKGHFAAPCAGSVFKNNRAFGAPSGKLLDDAGVRGLRVGGAAVSPQHANIIINTGGAKAQDIYELSKLMSEAVLQKTGFALESEILYLGDWD